MSDREMEMLSHFIDINRGPLRHLVFQDTGRRIVREKMGIGISNMSNMLRSLSGKDIIGEDEVLKYVMPDAFYIPDSFTYNVVLNAQEA